MQIQHCALPVILACQLNSGWGSRHIAQRGHAMASLIKPIINLQDAKNYKGIFERVGFKTVPERPLAQYQALLEQADISPIDSNHETIVVALKIQTADGVFSFLKSISTPTTDVSLFRFSQQDKNGNTTYNCRDGELLITNSRLILLDYQSKTKEIRGIYNWAFDKIRIQNVYYAKSIVADAEYVLMIKLNQTYDIHLDFKFPTQGILLAPIQTGHAKYKEKAKNAIYQFFLTVQTLLQADQQQNTSDQKPQEITKLIKKLNELKEAGILTDLEFQDKKQDLLSRL